MMQKYTPSMELLKGSGIEEMTETGFVDALKSGSNAPGSVTEIFQVPLGPALMSKLATCSADMGISAGKRVL